nr:hypothetical protein [Tanacetum cinerariifolium]
MEVGYGITDAWDDLVGAIQEIAPTTVRRGVDQRLFRDKRYHAHTVKLMEGEARASRTVWTHLMDASDAARFGVIALRTQILETARVPAQPKLAGCIDLFTRSRSVSLAGILPLVLLLLLALIVSGSDIKFSFFSQSGIQPRAKREEILEAGLPLQKSLCTAHTGTYELGESSAAAAARLREPVRDDLYRSHPGDCTDYRGEGGRSEVTELSTTFDQETSMIYAMIEEKRDD